VNSNLQFPLHELRGTRRGVFDMWTWMIHIDVPFETISSELARLDARPTPDPNGDFAVYVHELVHFFQTVASPVVIRLMHDFDYMYASLLNELDRLPLKQLPVPMGLSTPGYSRLTNAASRETEFGVSLLDVLEGEAFYYQHFFTAPETRDDPSVTAIRTSVGDYRLAERDLPTLSRYTNAYLVASSYLDKHISQFLGPGCVDVLFPYICNFALYSPYTLRTRDGVCESAPQLFSMALQFLARELAATDLMVRHAHPDPNLVYSFFMNELCETYGLERIPYQDTFMAAALNELERLYSDDEFMSNAPAWYAVRQVSRHVQVVGSIAGSGHQWFLFPFIARNLKKLFDLLGHPPVVYRNMESGEYHVMAHTELAQSLLRRGMLLRAIANIFEPLREKHICPHVECSFHKLSICREWYLYPREFPDCRFPAAFQEFTGLSLERLRA